MRRSVSMRKAQRSCAITIKRCARRLAENNNSQSEREVSGPAISRLARFHGFRQLASRCGLLLGIADLARRCHLAPAAAFVTGLRPGPKAAIQVQNLTARDVCISSDSPRRATEIDE